MSNQAIIKFYEFNFLHKFWSIVDYEDDHINILNQREDNRMEISFTSQQMENRTTLVELIKEIAISKQLDQLSIHLAVYILDVIMDIHEIRVDRLKLVALAALLVATKFEERDSHVLKASEINSYVEYDYLLSEYHIMEILILKYLKWNMNIPTVVHFVNVYLEFLFSVQEMTKMCLVKSSAEIWHEVRHIVKKYMDYVIDDIVLMHEKPSKVAAAIMACTRCTFNFNTIYPSQLFVISKYRLFELKVLIGRLKNCVQVSVHDINGD